MDDAKFMLNITKLIMKNPALSNELLYEILAKVTNRMEEDFDSANPDIENFHDIRTMLFGHVFMVSMGYLTVSAVQLFMMLVVMPA